MNALSGKEPVDLSDKRRQQGTLEAFRAFAAEELTPFAGKWDREQALPSETITKIAERGYLGMLVPTEYAGQGEDFSTFGLLCEAVGGACSSVRFLLTAHTMAAQALTRWGSPALRSRYLEPLACGSLIGAFCLSEPGAGSDVQAIAARGETVGDQVVLSGSKTWISFGQIADLLVVFARVDDKPTALVVETRSPGVQVTPLRDMLGARAAMLARIDFDAVTVPCTKIIGGLGMGLSAVAASALALGRYSVACGTIGLAQTCLDASARYALQRRASGVPISQHQLVRRMVTNMSVEIEAARLLCHQAGRLLDDKAPEAMRESFAAKYLASVTALRVAADAVQILGAAGCSAFHPVERMFRDAKVMEVIEGSNEIQQDTIARFCFQQYEAQQ